MTNTSQQIEFLNLYEVHGHHDKTEGRAGTYRVGLFIDLASATEAAQGHGVWGHPGDVAKPAAGVRIDGLYFLLRDGCPTRDEVALRRAARAKACAKLTPEERALLGVKENDDDQ